MTTGEKARFWRRSYGVRTGDGGYTLLELLAVLAIVGMVMVSLASILISAQRAYVRIDDYAEIQENARVGLEMIIRDIKGCRAVVSAGTGSLSLTGGDGSSVRYHVSSGTLYRTAKGTSNPVANSVICFTATREGPELLEVTLSAGSGEFDYRLTTRAKRMSE